MKTKLKQISGGRDPIRWTITTPNVELPNALLKSIEDWCRLQRKRNRKFKAVEWSGKVGVK